MNRMHRYSLFIRYICMFLLVLGLPVAIMMGVIRQNINSLMDKELETTIQTAADQAVSELNQQVLEMEAVFSALQTDPKIRTMASNMHRQHEAIMEKYDGIQKMATYISINPFVDEIMLAKGNVVLSNNGIPLEAVQQKLRSILQGHKNERTVYDPQIDDNFCYYIREMTLPKGVSCSVVFRVSFQTLRKQLTGIPHGNEFLILMLDNEGNTLYSNLTDAAPTEATHRAELKKWFSATLNSRTFLCYITKIEKAGIETCFFLPEEVVAAPQRQILVVYWYYLGFALALGILLSLYFSYQNARPLQPLLEDAEVEKNIQNMGSLKSIEYAYSRTTNANRELRELLSEFQAIAARQFILKLFHESSAEEEILVREAQKYDLSFEAASYRVLVLQIPSEAGKEYSDEDYDQMIDVLNDVFHAVNSVSLTVARNTLATLLNYNGQLGTDEIGWTAKKILTEIQASLGYTVFIGISAPVSGLSFLCNAYTQAEVACEAAISSGTRQIVLAEDLPETENVRITKRTKQGYDLSELSKAMASGNADRIDPAILDFFDMVRWSNLGDDAIKSIIRETMALVLKTIPLERLSQENVNRLINSNGLDDLENSLLSISQSCFHREAESDPTATSGYALLACNYINNQYKNFALNPDAVAEHLHLSRSYLTRIFSREMHIPPTEYINRTRIHVSCILLKNTEKTLMEVGREVGYEDLHTFLRNFKKYNGITPTQYRNRTRGKEKES